MLLAHTTALQHCQSQETHTECLWRRSFQQPAMFDIAAPATPARATASAVTNKAVSNHVRSPRLLHLTSCTVLLPRLLRLVPVHNPHDTFKRDTEAQILNPEGDRGEPASWVKACLLAHSKIFAWNQRQGDIIPAPLARWIGRQEQAPCGVCGLIGKLPCLGTGLDMGDARPLLLLCECSETTMCPWDEE